ncbi:aromatic ring-hydroxylating dioxygenase subunit alpha [Temperatibacter marinus]|uniref:Aromatic ring-hydroxylating dioxygenase subunit alpha n=1 Tax=Temperatibacter marinus TaxID=1456591 RepID=A0AA52EJQ8_9PROT|nr:aromatic ring-hydroxylating dioxygenase subunit alpha [Temperatibacter marinus]WND03524.1 aromatic ring-hydroxylating dioxygenase subunit alpha [Temperatibacter marinus]
MLVNLWYVAEWSKNVKNDPVKVQILGQKLVLFRDSEGKIACLADICLHRGGSLGNGWCKDGNVACPYHGWEYNTEGECVHIPSEGPEAKISKRFKVDRYDAEERYGMIWVFMGDLPEEERFPIPPFPEYDQKEYWREVTTEYTWKAEASRVVENGIDLAHASFVHPTFGYQDTAGDNSIDHVEINEWWGTSTNTNYPPQLKGDLGFRRFIRKDKQPTRTHPTWYLPGMIVRMQIDLREGWTIIMFDANTPIDEHTTRTFAIQLRSFMKWPMFDKGSKKRLEKILHEDAAIVEESQPYYLPETLANELSVGDDKFMNSFRKARRILIEEKGWQIDLKKRDTEKGRTVMTIPSPARKKAEAGGIKWVFEKMPTVGPVSNKKSENRMSQNSSNNSA